jgi:hypothetical protein
MISNYFFVIFKFFTNKSLSPSHRSISDILGLFCIWVLRRTILEEAFHLKLITQPNAGIDPNKTISQVTVDIVKCISYLVMIFAMFVFLQTFVTLISIKRKKENIGIPKNMASSQKKDATSTHIIRTNRWAGKKLVALMILISSGILVLAFCLALSITHDILYPL